MSDFDSAGVQVACLSSAIRYIGKKAEDAQQAVIAVAVLPEGGLVEDEDDRLTDECDGLKLRLAATEDIQQELAAARKALSDAGQLR